MCDQRGKIPRTKVPGANYTVFIFRRQYQLEGSFETVLEKFLTCRARESRSKACWYGLHIRLRLTWAQCSATPCGALAYNESECVRLISISGSVSKWHLISDAYDATSRHRSEIDSLDLII